MTLSEFVRMIFSLTVEMGPVNVCCFYLDFIFSWGEADWKEYFDSRNFCSLELEQPLHKSCLKYIKWGRLMLSFVEGKFLGFQSDEFLKLLLDFNFINGTFLLRKK